LSGINNYNVSVQSFATKSAINFGAGFDRRRLIDQVTSHCADVSRKMPVKAVGVKG
jgi:hypothetical protein